MIYRPILPTALVGVICVLLLGCYIYGIKRKTSNRRSKVFGIIRIVMMLALLFVINLRPMRKVYDVQAEMKNIDVLFVVDTTISMWADDYDSSDISSDIRMDAVENDISYIIEELLGGNFGLIRFDNRSQILAPFTMDSDTVLDAVSTITMPDNYYAKGSNLNVVYDDLESLLISSSKKEDRMTILFFISDGEITDGSTLRSYAELEKYVDGGAVLGYGTEEGGEMSTSYGKIKDPETGANGVSCIDEANLQQIADDLNIDYIHMTRQSNVSYLVESVKNGSKMILTNADAVDYEDTYFYFVIPLFILLVMEVVIFLRRGHI